MTDEERAAFTNLILTCKPHHDLIDRLQPDRFSVSLLHEWKAAREADNASELRGLTGLTEQRLMELIESAYRAGLPRREVSIEMAGFFFTSEANGYSIPLGAWRSTLELNPYLVKAKRAIVVTARNIGDAPVSIEAFTLAFVFNDQNNKQQVALLAGANDFPLHNPQLPKVLEAGTPAINWLTSLSTLQTFLPALLAVGEVEIRANARLGSGEEISTDTYPVTLIPFND